MFEDALLESSPRRASVLSRIHYLLSALAGTLIFAQVLYSLPLLLVPAGGRARFIAAALAGVVGAAYTLMICYVWADTRQQHLRPWPWFAVTLLLNLPGFLIYLVYSARKTGDWKRAAMPLAYVAESLLVGALILVPLVYTQALPRQWLITEFHIPPPPGPPPAQPAGQRPKPAPHPAVDPMAAPISIPTFIATVVDPPEPPPREAGLGLVVPGVPGGFAGGIGSTPYSPPWVDGPLPPPPVSHDAPTTKMLRLSSGVVAAKAVYQPKPVYPSLAVTARVQGTVVLQAIIGKDGAVQDLKVLGGQPLLIRAALEAVRIWRYQPTLLNGEPVEVLTEISVNFTLSE